MKVFSRLLNLVQTQTLKDTAVVTIGNGFSTIFSAVCIFLIARFLGPADFGLYITAWAIIIILIDSIDLAINNALVKFASQTSPARNSLIKYGFKLKLTLGLGVTVIFALISQPLAGWLYPDLKQPLLLTASFILVTFLFRFPKSILQSEKRFLNDTSIDIVISLLRLASILIFYFTLKLTVVNSLFAYFIGATVGFALGAKFIRWDFLAAKITKKTKKTFLHFQKWLTLGYIIAAIHGRIDAAILLKLTDPIAVGIYQAAYRFFIPALQLAGALTLVFAPRFASFPDKIQQKSYLYKSFKLSLGLAGLSLLLIPLAPFLVKLIFGSQYLQAVLPTRILSLGFAFFIAGAPFVAHLIYAANKTKLFFLINLLQFGLLIFLDFLLIPIFGAVGAAWAMAITLMVINLILAFIALR